MKIFHRPRTLSKRRIGSQNRADPSKLSLSNEHMTVHAIAVRTAEDCARCLPRIIVAGMSTDTRGN